MDEVEIQVEVNLTEDEAKVKRAVENIFSSLQFEQKPLKRGSVLTARANGREALTKLYNLLRRERIRAATRSVLFKGLDGRSIVFYLNKQAAFAGHVSFSQPTGESPLGPVRVEIKSDDPVQLIEWLAPKAA